MNSTSLTKPVDLQGLSLALAKTKADYEAKIDYINSKPFYVEITDDMESEEEFAWLSDKTYSEIDFTNGKGIPIYFRYGDYEGKAIRDYDGNFYAMCFDFTSATDTLMGVRIEIDSEDNVNVINDINIPNITSIPQSDWNETDTTDNDYILNKPAIKAGEGENSIIEGQLEQADNSAVYTIYVTGDANATTYTFTTDDDITVLTKILSVCKYNDKYYSVDKADLTNKTITFNKTLSTSALANVEVIIYSRYKNAVGTYSHAEGQQTFAGNISAHSEGFETKALSQYSHAEGYGAITEGIGSHAEGLNTMSFSNGSHAEGVSTRAEAMATHAEGQATKATKSSSHSEGYHTAALNSYAHAEGYYTKSSGFESHSEGGFSAAVGNGSHAEGLYAYSEFTVEGEANSLTYTLLEEGAYLRDLDRIDGLYIYYDNGVYPIVSITLSQNKCLTSFTLEKTLEENEAFSKKVQLCIGNVAIGSGAHAEGAGSYAIGKYSHTEGLATNATKYGSHAEGNQTFSESDFQHVQGKFNIADTSGIYAHIVGNGTSHSDRSNAHTLDWSGNGWYAGKLTVGADPVNDMDVATKQYVDEHGGTNTVNVSFNNPSGIGEAIVGTTTVGNDNLETETTYQSINDNYSNNALIYFNYYDYHGQAYKNSDGSFSAICFKSNDLEKTEGIKIIYKSDGTITSSRFYVPVPEDDINILNLLSDYGFVSPISDASGNVIVDVDGNLILG